MNTLNRIVGLCIGASALAACSAADVNGDSESIDTADGALYVSSPDIWQNHNIPVCWENPGNDATQRGWVREQITNTWDAVSSVNFTGWGTCASSSSGIRIRIEDSGPHVKFLGSALAGVSAGMVLNFTFLNWSQACQGSEESCIRSIAVHEFGHALGFAHEHNRDDTPSSCTDAPQGSDGDLVVGSWDLSSVMNYCNPKYNGDGNLSETDIEGVHLAYELGFTGLIVSEENDKCLDVFQASGDDGAAVVTWPCHGNDNQRWDLAPRSDGYFNVINRNSGKCLDVEGASAGDGAALLQWTCSGDDNQAWRVESSGGATRLVAKHSGRCLNLTASSQDDGAAVAQNACDGGGSQRWSIKP
ncbi:RICIN domain-containing protein [Sorangium sp. So ce321]|uniref:RICIN domain-containing protein n=1 Tax=Sorangium sp. So ce321 TaxID=3133300 RepID=UPI003F624FD2